MDNVTIREGTPDDLVVIYATWLRSYKRGSEFASLVPWNIYFDGHHEVVEAILSRPTTKILVACEKDLLDVVQGYLVWEKDIADRPVVHYIYTKEMYQRRGVAKSLIESANIDARRVYFSHHTRDRIDPDRKSPLYGTLRYRGAETLLRKWPMQRHRLEVNGGSKIWKKIDGNIYCPYLVNGKMPRPVDGKALEVLHGIERI